MIGWISACLGLCLAAAAPVEELAAARDHFQHGRYAEAVETLAEIQDPGAAAADIAILAAQAQWALGERDAAEKTCDEALRVAPQHARLLAWRAWFHLERGRGQDAEQCVKSALAADAEELLARLVQARLWTETGQLKPAGEGYRWFVRYYNRKQPTDAEALLLVAEGASQYARWNSVSQIFDFTLNTLCADALKADPSSWQAKAVAGRLLLEKYNRAQALPELKAALAINPNAAAVHVALADAALQDLGLESAEGHADRALEIDPEHPDALRIKAEVAFQQGRLADARTLVDRALRSRPWFQEALALSVFLHLLHSDELPVADLRERLGQLEDLPDLGKGAAAWERQLAELARRNPRPGYFLNEFGRLYELQRKFAHAECCYQQAIASMPQLAQPKTELGMLYLQTGRLTDARKLLDDAFKADPYHVRVSNMRKVLSVLDGYRTITTPHFVIRADEQLDGLLAKYMAEHLEEIYPELTAQFGYEPPQRTQIEIYNKAKGLGGHQWFSARMIGLPWIQTIGASTGMLIAMTSPSATDEPFNWARVVRHEFVHVLTLQQTDFNIPHWFTEALAVRAEELPPPRQWRRLLLQRVPAGNLRNLDNLNLGFQRADSRDDWDFAYCQSVAYADYFVERFGADALPRLLEAYRKTRSTTLALQQAYGVTQADVEPGYRAFLERRVREMPAWEVEEEADPAAVRQAFEAMPDDPDAKAAFALAELNRGQFKSAAERSREVLEVQPKQPTAAFVAAQLLVREKREAEALQLLEQAYDPERAHRRLWLLLGQLRLKHGAAASALEVFQRGRARFLGDPVWSRGVAEAAEAAEKPDLQREALEFLVTADSDSADPRVKLAELALDADHFERAAQFCRLALQVDVMDADVHLMFARVLRGLKRPAAALAEYEATLQLAPKEIDAALEAVEVDIELNQRDAARKRVEQVLQDHPENSQALRLRARLAAPK